ncbi:MAG: HAMP domain-containing protein [Ruthenibacterium sp.]
MKIAQKLTLCLVAVTGALFLVGGYRMVSQNFEASLEQAAAQNAAQHTAQRLSVEDAALRLAMQQASGESVLHAAGTEVAAAMPQAQFALMNEGWANLYSRVPQQVDKNMLIEAARAAQGGYVLRKAQENTYMFVAGTLTAGSTQGTLVSVFDVTQLYAQRTAQLHRFWRLCAVMLCAAAVLTLCFTTIVLRPLKRLSAAAASIAAGQYGQRTQVHTQDEVGRLSQDFDAMAASVEQAMESLEDEVRRRDDFVAAFTHEIKTPMTAMLGYADLLRSRDVGKSAREKAADYVYHETKRLEALSLKLLELMRLGHEGAGLESVPLSAVFSDVRHACAGLEGQMSPSQMPAASGFWRISPCWQTFCTTLW